MKEKHLAVLEKIGLPTAEAEIYLALVRAGTPMGASAIVTATGVPRGSIYPALSSLADKGLVEAEPGYGGRFSAIPAERALPFLIKREKEELAERETLAAALANELKSEHDPAETLLSSELIKVLKDPRVVAEHFERLQLETERQIDGFIKAPLFNVSNPENPAQMKAIRRGVHYRGLYERAVLDDPAIEPYLANWVAKGEEIRVYDGKLPHKLAIFDSKIALMPLILPGEQLKALLIRNRQLAETLGHAFERFWEQSKPINLPKRRKKSSPIQKHETAGPLTIGGNGRRPSLRGRKLKT